ncbi:hypothetical protein ABKN59_007839 [Abortiporus biennis]
MVALRHVVTVLLLLLDKAGRCPPPSPALVARRLATTTDGASSPIYAWLKNDTKQHYFRVPFLRRLLKMISLIAYPGHGTGPVNLAMYRGMIDFRDTDVTSLSHAYTMSIVPNLSNFRR